jgi:hypothetical protein
MNMTVFSRGAGHVKHRDNAQDTTLCLARGFPKPLKTPMQSNALGQASSSREGRVKEPRLKFPRQPLGSVNSRLRSWILRQLTEIQ